MPKAVSRLDDMLIAGTNYDDHLDALLHVFERLLEAGFRLNKANCKFLSSVLYLGHRIDTEGLHPTEDTLIAIRHASRARDVTALKSCLELLIFYSLNPACSVINRSVKIHKADADRSFLICVCMLTRSQRHSPNVLRGKFAWLRRK